MTPFIPGPRGRRLNRRGFLKLSALTGLAAAVRLPDPGLRIATALPLPGYPVTSFDAWPHRPPPGFDLLRLPAYLAAAYIRTGAVLPLARPRPRARPRRRVHPAQPLPRGRAAQCAPGPGPPLAHLWTQPPGAAWPNSAPRCWPPPCCGAATRPTTRTPATWPRPKPTCWPLATPERLAAPDLDLLARPVVTHHLRARRAPIN